MRHYIFFLFILLVSINTGNSQTKSIRFIESIEKLECLNSNRSQGWLKQLKHRWTDKNFAKNQLSTISDLGVAMERKHFSFDIHLFDQYHPKKIKNLPKDSISIRFSKQISETKLVQNTLREYNIISEEAFNKVNRMVESQFIIHPYFLIKALKLYYVDKNLTSKDSKRKLLETLKPLISEDRFKVALEGIETGTTNIEDIYSSIGEYQPIPFKKTGDLDSLSFLLEEILKSKIDSTIEISIKDSLFGNQLHKAFIIDRKDIDTPYELLFFNNYWKNLPDSNYWFLDNFLVDHKFTPMLNQFSIDSGLSTKFEVISYGKMLDEYDPYFEEIISYKWRGILFYKKGFDKCKTYRPSSSSQLKYKTVSEEYPYKCCYKTKEKIALFNKIDSAGFFERKTPEERLVAKKNVVHAIFCGGEKFLKHSNISLNDYGIVHSFKRALENQDVEYTQKYINEIAKGLSDDRILIENIKIDFKANILNFQIGKKKFDHQLWSDEEDLNPYLHFMLSLSEAIKKSKLKGKIYYLKRFNKIKYSFNYVLYLEPIEKKFLSNLFGIPFYDLAEVGLLEFE